MGRIWRQKLASRILEIITVFVYRDSGVFLPWFLTDLSLGPLRQAAGLVEEHLGTPSCDEVVQVRGTSDQSVGAAAPNDW